ncbi:MAG TPA: RNA polymerase sigma factor [Flavobacteriaceae bacterium]|nr:RNA polymerase sigma factor [Flavobacteriaceae bacterium]
MNQQAFLGIFDPLRDRMYRLSLRLLVSKEAAEDAVQEVLLKLWERKEKLQKYDSPQAYAMTIAKNHCLDQLKSKQNNNLRIVHSNYEENNTPLQKQLEAKNDFELLQEIMKTLPDQQKAIIQLRDIEEMEYEEIAEIMNMNETAVRVALSRGRKKLREALLKKHRYGTV